MSVKITLHPALHRTRMPMSEAIDNPGTICPVRIIGRPGMLMLHVVTISTHGYLQLVT